MNKKFLMSIQLQFFRILKAELTSISFFEVQVDGGEAITLKQTKKITVEARSKFVLL